MGGKRNWPRLVAYFIFTTPRLYTAVLTGILDLAEEHGSPLFPHILPRHDDRVLFVLALDLGELGHAGSRQQRQGGRLRLKAEALLITVVLAVVVVVVAVAVAASSPGQRWPLRKRDERRWLPLQRQCRCLEVVVVVAAIVAVEVAEAHCVLQPEQRRVGETVKFCCGCDVMLLGPCATLLGIQHGKVVCALCNAIYEDS